MTFGLDLNPQHYDLTAVIGTVQGMDFEMINTDTGASEIIPGSAYEVIKVLPIRDDHVLYVTNTVREDGLLQVVPDVTTKAFFGKED